MAGLVVVVVIEGLGCRACVLFLARPRLTAMAWGNRIDDKRVQERRHFTPAAVGQATASEDYILPQQINRRGELGQRPTVSATASSHHTGNRHAHREGGFADATVPVYWILLNHGSVFVWHGLTLRGPDSNI